MSWPGEGEGRWPISWSLQAPFVRKGSEQLSEWGAPRGRDKGSPSHTLSLALLIMSKVMQSRASWQDSKEGSWQWLGLLRMWKALLAPLQWFTFWSAHSVLVTG